jgi:hypothetical protein
VRSEHLPPLPLQVHERPEVAGLALVRLAPLDPIQVVAHGLRVGGLAALREAGEDDELPLPNVERHRLRRPEIEGSPIRLS